MQITLKELKALISEAVRTRLTEGTKEIPIRMAMDDIKSAVVESITEDIMRELSIEESVVTSVVSRAYDKMVMEVVRELDKPELQTGVSPRRRIVGVV